MAGAMLLPLRFSEFVHYCAQLDCEAVRLSTWRNGAEYYALIPTDNGRRWRENRELAAQALTLAARNGGKPGEVQWR